MRTFLEEFKTFATRGNVIDLAVAVVVGTAFGHIVSSLVDNVITPLAGIFLGGVDLSNLSFAVGDAVITYGTFVQSILDFVIIAFVVFVAIKLVNRFNEEEERKPEAEKMALPSEEVKLLREIRDSLKK